MKNFQNNIILFTLCFAGLLFFGCRNSFTNTPESNNPDIPAGQGLVRISLNTTAAQAFPEMARTALPPMTGFFFTLKISPKNGDDTITINLDNGQITIEQSLMPGEWNITVTGYSSIERNEDDSVLEGKTVFEIKAGDDINVTVFVGFTEDPDGDGWIEYTIEFPDDLSSADLRIFTLANPPGIAAEIDLLLTGNGTNANGIISVPNGVYQILIELLDENNGKKAVITELAHVRDQTTTFLEREFTVDNFFTHGMPIKDISDIRPYLLHEPGGEDADNPISLELELPLTETNWLGILNAIAGVIPPRYVDIDLSACERSGDADGGGLRSGGEFDPMSTVSTGKSRIVGIVLPDAAESIVNATFFDSTFNYFNSLRSAEGRNVLIIGNDAFRSRTSLTSVSFQLTENIGRTAFDYCTSLIEVNFPAVTSIGMGAFSNCTSLLEINFPAATNIVGSAFFGCTSLTSVSLPAVTSIDGDVFSNSTSLVSISFPATANITGNPFSGCTSLVLFDLTGSGHLSVIENGRALVQNGTNLIAYPTVSGTITLNTITSIGIHAFRYCTSLEGLIIPSVTNIGTGAFSDTETTPLSITLGNNAPTLGSSIFLMVFASKTVTVQVPLGSTGYGLSPTDTTTENWGNAFRGMGWDGTDYIFPNSVNTNINLEIIYEPLRNATQIEDYLSSLTTGGATTDDPVNLPVIMQLTDENWQAILQAIDDASPPRYVDLDLSACTRADVNSGGGLHSNGTFEADIAFSTGKEWIVSLILPDDAETVGGFGNNIAADVYFISLRTVSGTEVNAIGNFSFWNCTSLISVIFPKATSIGNQAFLRCTNLTNADFPLVTSIDNQAFQYCTSLTSVDFPLVTSLGSGAFNNCTSLTSVEFPLVTSIGSGTFLYCTSLTSVDFPLATSISQQAFYRTSLTSVDFPLVTSIGANAFSYCLNLSSMSFPTVNNIGHTAFSFTGSTPLTIYLGDNAPALEIIFFEGVNNPKPVTIRVPFDATGYTGFPVVNATDQTWANAFRGMSWNPETGYGTGTVNTNINLSIEYMPITNPSQIAGYLSTHTGGTDANDPIPLPINMQLTDTDWRAILQAIESAGKFVELDFSECTPSGENSGGGLLSSGEFNMLPGVSDGKEWIVSLVLPDSTTSLGSNAFQGCTNLTRITLPSGLISIGNGAFAGCASLISVTIYAAAPPVLGTDVFHNTHDDLRIRVPTAGLDNYIQAPSWDYYSLIIFAFDGQAGITFNFDEGQGAFSEVTFTINRTGSNQSRTITISSTDYTNPRWWVNGELKNTGDSSFVVRASEYPLGGNTLSLWVDYDNFTWSKELVFTVNP